MLLYHLTSDAAFSIPTYWPVWALDPSPRCLGSFPNCMRLVISFNVNRTFSDNRPDRDENLDVIEANVNPNKWSQYDIPTPAEHVDLDPTIPYDYNSIMHYGKYYFARRDSRVRIYLNYT